MLTSLLISLLIIGIGIPVGKSIAESIKPHAGSWLGVWSRGALISLAFGVLAFVTTGQASCEEYDDPLRGSCTSYADNGYNWTASKALENGFTSFFRTVTAGTIGLLLLKRELKKAGNGWPDFGGEKILAMKLAGNKDLFRDTLKILAVNIAFGNHRDPEWRKDFKATNAAVSMALEIIKKNQMNVHREEFLAIFISAKVSLFGKDTEGTVFE